VFEEFLGEVEMIKFKFIVLIIGLISLLIPISSPALAKSEIIRASYKYTMGDNDTKNDAKTLCFLGAKRRLLEQVGTFITSKTEMTDFKLTKDEIKSYSAAFLKIEVENEKTEVTGETSAIVMTVKTNVDLDEIKKIINRIINDASLKSEITEKNKKISLLEERIQKLQKQLASTDYNKSFGLREERKETFGTLDIENENIKQIILAQKKREIERPKVIASNAKIVRAILKNVQCGMKLEELTAVIKEVAGDLKLFSSRGAYPRWGRLEFAFERDDYYQTSFLHEIHYELEPSYDRGGQSVHFTVILKAKEFDILLNHGQIETRRPPYGLGGGITRTKINKNVIRKKYPDMYKYIWAD
jgi:hypothetical protein